MFERLDNSTDVKRLTQFRIALQTVHDINYCLLLHYLVNYLSKIL